MNNNLSTPQNTSTFPATNQEFLNALFGTAVGDAYVTGFAEDPTAQHTPATRAKMWRGQRWGDLRKPLPREWNNYFAISTFRPSTDPADRGAHRRRKALFTAAYVIVFDDVGQKVPWANVVLPPSYALMTSPGNCQVGYRLAAPEADAALVERLIDGLIVNGLAMDAKDPGMRGVTRYVRLPYGTNHKSKYGALGVACKLEQWHPERAYTVEQIAAAHGISLAAPAHTTRARAALGLSGEQQRALTEAMLAALEAEGLVIGEDANAPGKWHLRCPWIAEHQDGDEGGSAYFEPGYTDKASNIVSAHGGYKCHHGHCEHRHLRDVVQWLRAAGHAGVRMPGEVTPDMEFEQLDRARLEQRYADLLERNEETRLIKSSKRHNAELIMLHDTDICNAVRFNEFTNTYEIVRPGITNLDSFVAWVLVDIEREYDCVFSEATVRLMLYTLLDANRYDPLRDWAQAAAAQWDGTARLDNMLVEHAGADAQPAEYVRAVTRAFMVGAAHRALTPGYKFDNMLIFEGRTGIGKSTLCATLAPRPVWGAAGILDVQHKDAVADLQGKFIYEMEELQTFRRTADIEALKAFLSRPYDRVRLSYRRDSVDYPRRVVFIGTTEKKKYLEEGDTTTAPRRFWPIKVSAISRTWFPTYMPQVWAEAAAAALSGEPPVPDKSVFELIEAEQRARAFTIAEHPLYEKLMALWDDEEYKHRWPDSCTTDDVLNMLGEKPTRANQMLVSQMLTEAGYEHRRAVEHSARRWRWYDTGRRFFE